MKTMPLPEIIDTLCALTGCSRTQAEQFVIAFEDSLSDGLLESGSVAIDGIGVFRLIASEGEPKIEFAPDPELAEAVNAPFAIFEPIELDDEVTGDMLRDAAEAADDSVLLSSEEDTDEEEETEDDADITDEGTDEVTPSEESATPAAEISDNEDSAPEVEPASAPESIPEPEPVPVPEPAAPAPEAPSELPPPIPESILKAQQTPPSTPPPSVPEAPEPTPGTRSSYDEDLPHYNYRDESHRRSPNLFILAVVCLIIGAVIGYFGYYLINLYNVRSVNISASDVQIYHNGASPVIVEALPADSVDVDSISSVTEATEIFDDSITADSPAVTSQPAVVTDTVRPGRFLTTMALEHYGKKKFWVYIYKENEDRLGNPDQIAPNTVVIIPPAEKYGINPSDKASNDDAARLSAEILARYN